MFLYFVCAHFRKKLIELVLKKSRTLLGLKCDNSSIAIGLRKYQEEGGPIRRILV